MSIPFGERRKLRALERSIADGAPALAERFMMFCTLYRRDDMPPTERLKAREIRRRAMAEWRAAPWLPT